jgi:outer membrane murein-binding lipoprotein Lpp
MNEKAVFYSVIAVAVLLATWMVSGCRSQPNAAGANILQSAEDTGRFKEQNRQLAEIVNDLVSGIESIESRIDRVQDGIESAQADARGAEQDIDRAIQLFTAYKSRIDQFLDDYRKLQEQAQNSR